MPPRFGTDGLRGVANSELSAQLALLLGRATARCVDAPCFLVGRDTRRSGTMLLAALAAGFAAEGADVLDVGVVPTPGLAWLAAERALPAAMVSASHNPFPDNGIKLLSPNGTKLALALEAEIEAELDRLVADPPPPEPTGAAVGTIEQDPCATEPYLAHLAGSVHLENPSRLKVVCDCANGAASALAGPLFERLFVDAVLVAASPDGTNINDRCGSTHAELLAQRVLDEGASLGLCLDGDADRLIALDEEGNLVDGDHLLALFAADLHERGALAKDAIAITVMSNLGLRLALAQRGVDVVETPLGDRHVVDAMAAEGLVLGGEQSGHLIFSSHATTGDGLLTAVQLLELLDRRDAPLSHLSRQAMVRLPQELRNVAVARPGELDGASAVWEELARVEAELGTAGRVLLRASGTEPAVRVMVEATSAEQAHALADRLAEVVRANLAAPPR